MRQKINRRIGQAYVLCRRDVLRVAFLSIGLFLFAVGCKEPGFKNVQASRERSKGACPIDWRAWHECVHIEGDKANLPCPANWLIKQKIGRKCSERVGVKKEWQRLSDIGKEVCFDAYLFEQEDSYLMPVKNPGPEWRVCSHVDEDRFIDYLEK